MKKQLVFLTMLGLSLTLSPLAVLAEEGTLEAAGVEMTGVSDAVEPVEVGNKICPVGGEPVGTMGEVVKLAHNGKIYNFCCAMCLDEFNKNPDKYSKMADDEVAHATSDDHTGHNH